MNKPAGALGLLAVLMLDGGIAHAQIRYEMLKPTIRCEVYVGVHVALQNMSLFPLGAGTIVQWSLAGGATGTYSLPVTLVPQGGMLIEHALRMPVRGQRCAAKIL